MSHARLKSDQLWRFFCPALHLTRPQRQSLTVSTTRLRCPSSIPQATTTRCAQKRYNSSQFQFGSYRNTGNTYAREESWDSPEDSGIQDTLLLRHLHGRDQRDAPTGMLTEPTAILEGRLARLTGKPGNLTTATQILPVLIRNRRVRPQAWHYKVLIRCNRDPIWGSAVMARELLNEMEERGFPIDSDVLHIMLEVLVVHQNPTLRQEVLAKLQDRHLPLTSKGWHNVVMGFAKEHQYQQAQEHIENMQRKHIEIEGWLHKLLVERLCDDGLFDQVLQLLNSQMSQEHQLSKKTWTYILDKAATAKHHALTRFIWDKYVELDAAAPTKDTCFSVLKVAASKGDGHLVTSVTQIANHHQWLQVILDDFAIASQFVAFHRSGNLYGALELLCNLRLKKRRSLRDNASDIIIAHCREKKTPPREIWNILKELKSTGQKIPLLCMRLVIEMCVTAAADDPFAVDDGINFYKELHSLCDQGPDLSIFNRLIEMCRVSKHIDAVAFFIQEMNKLGIQPDSTTGQLIVMAFVAAKVPRVVQFYLDEAHQERFELSNRSRHAIRTACQQSGNASIITLQEHPALAKTRLTKYNKLRRKDKRRGAAIAATQEAQKSAEYEPSLSTPEDLREKEEKIQLEVAEIRKNSSG